MNKEYYPSEKQRALQELRLRVIDALRVDAVGEKLSVVFISCYDEEMEKISEIADPTERERQLKILIARIVHDGTS